MSLPPAIEALVQAALAAPKDVNRRMAAAYACDRGGYEDEALVHYQAAHALGVPEKFRVGFMLGFGSTLKNNGRLEDSERVLREAIALAPAHEGLRAFLALTLHAQGKSGLALATMLELLLEMKERAPGVAAYAAALGEYAAELRADEAP